MGLSGIWPTTIASRAVPRVVPTSTNIKLAMTDMVTQMDKADHIRSVCTLEIPIRITATTEKRRRTGMMMFVGERVQA